MLVHAFGAYYGLAFCKAMYRKDSTESTKAEPSYNSDLFSLIGEFLPLSFPSTFNLPRLLARMIPLFLFSLSLILPTSLPFLRPFTFLPLSLPPFLFSFSLSSCAFSYTYPPKPTRCQFLTRFLKGHFSIHRRHIAVDLLAQF